MPRPLCYVMGQLFVVHASSLVCTPESVNHSYVLEQFHFSTEKLPSKLHVTVTHRENKESKNVIMCFYRRKIAHSANQNQNLKTTP